MGQLERARLAKAYSVQRGQGGGVERKGTSGVHCKAAK